MRQGTADKWAAFFGIPVREEEEYVRLQEERGFMNGVFSIGLDTTTAEELYTFVTRRKRDHGELWGVVPPYTGSDDFAGRLFQVLGNGKKAYWDSEQQHQTRQHTRLIVVIR